MKSCPFCGNEDQDELSFHHENSQADDRILCNAMCYKCGAMGPTRYNLNDAEEAWDTRPECQHPTVITAAHGHVCTKCERFLQ